MSKWKWEALPPDTKETCDRTALGWSHTSSPERCGKTATRINRSNCFCGECDMTCRLCPEHAAELLAAADKHGVAEPGLA